jgi:tetratricopeptide (TPR) repeat protein
VKHSLNSFAIWSEKFAAIEASVISGQHLNGRRILDELNPKTLPRDWACRYAELANRIHHSLFALKALHRFIRPFMPTQEHAATAATGAEKMAYAYALCILGATDEALDILSSIDSRALPEASFMKALTYFRKWNYAQSIPLLKNFLNSQGVSSYRILVGEVNLVAALIITGQFDEASLWLEKVQQSCQDGSYHLLLGNSFELKAQILFFQKKYAEALKCLDQAHALLKNQQGLYSLFVEKWQVVCELFQNGSNENIRRLRELRLKAIQLEDFETVRECDLFGAIATEDENLLRKVIMGTPSEYYRERARKLFGKKTKPLGDFEWVMNSHLPGEEVFFDPTKKLNGKAALYDQPHLLSLFQALTTDFYRPSHLGALFKAVYPEEKFNPYNSPGRVLQLLRRLDRWLQAQEAPVRVEFKKSQFSLTSHTPVRIQIQRGQKLSSVQSRWSELRDAFGDRAFNTAQISKILGLSKTSAQRLVRQALAQGQIRASGRGRGVAYQFNNRKKVKTAA